SGSPERSAADRERGPGASTAGTPGAFAERIDRERGRTSDPRRGDRLPPPSHADRVRPPRPRSLFDFAAAPEGPENSPIIRTQESDASLPAEKVASASRQDGTAVVELKEPASAGPKAKARDILAAIRTLQTIEAEQREATPQERAVLARFGGFGAVALSIFPDPATGHYKDASWQAIGE